MKIKTGSAIKFNEQTLEENNERWIELKGLYQRFNVAILELRFNKNSLPLFILYQEIERIAVKLGYNEIKPIKSGVVKDEYI